MLSNYEIAYNFITRTGRNVFITGKAGTGKTTFLHRLKSECSKQMVVAAPTGVAAINAGGVTLHSFFQLPFSPFLPTPEGRKELIIEIKLQGYKRTRIRELELLVIDEISMVRADVLDAIDTILRTIRHRFDEPFGGVQMVFIGDMFQLSPVAKADEMQLLSAYYESMYFFDSHVIRENPPAYVEFDRIFRQSDADFIELLNDIRVGSVTARSRQLLSGRHQPAFAPAKDDAYVILTTHNYKANAINASEMQKLDTEKYIFPARVDGTFPENSYPAEENLELKKGAKVMFLKNDNEERRFYNGKMGIVSSVGDDHIHVQCPGEEEAITVFPMVWENVNYTVNKETAQLEEKKLGSFTQYPLRLAWAITIHKSQGLTFDKVVIDPEDAFAAGQAYVALSRCRTLDGIVLKSGVNVNNLRNEKRVLDFSFEGTTQTPQLPEQLSDAEKKYRCALLTGIFNFASLQSLFSQLQADVLADAPVFGDESLAYLQAVNERIAHLKDVGARFGVQLARLMENDRQEAILHERLKASADYFIPLIAQLTELLSQSPVTTDNRALAMEFDKNWEACYTLLAQKKHAIEGTQGNFSVQSYFDHRKRFSYRLPDVTAYAPHRKKYTQRESVHPELLNRLSALRREIATEENAKAYQVFHTEALKAMALHLPETIADFLRIKGVGKRKAGTYGTRFLEEINAYCHANGIEKRMDDESGDLKQEKKKKPQVKGASALESYALYRRGKSIAEIAAERNLTENTIAGHLGTFITKGELDISDFLSSEVMDRAVAMMKSASGDLSLYERLSGTLTQPQISLFSAWWRKNRNQ